MTNLLAYTVLGALIGRFRSRLGFGLIEDYLISPFYGLIVGLEPVTAPGDFHEKALTHMVSPNV